MTTPEGWREGARVKMCVLGGGRRERVGREEGAWPTHLALWDWVSIWVVVFSHHCHH